MNKMNKKGFTLIEMLVVIAIIAILVSIIVPVVGSSAKRAAAATNAANLRSAAATISIDLLTKGGDFSGDEEITDLPDNFTTPVAKTNGNLEGGAFHAYVVDGAVECYFGDHGVDYYADIAEDGKLDGEYSGPNVNPEQPDPEQPDPEQPDPEQPEPEIPEQPAGYECDGSHRDTDPQDNVCDDSECGAVFTPAHDETVGCTKDCQGGTYDDYWDNTCNNCNHPKSEHSNIDYSYPNNGQGKCNHTETVHVDGTWS